MSESPQSDLVDATVAAATTGDERAIDAIWHGLQPALLRYLRSLGVHDAEDVASTTWLELSRVLAALEPPTVEALRRLLFTIARRRMVDELRRRRSRPDPAGDWDLDPAAEDDGGLGAALEHLRSLSPAQAEVIALRVIVGMSAEEVGELTGQSAGAVRVMAHRGLATLRQRLAQDEGHLGQSTQIGSDDVTNAGQPTIDGVQ